MSTDISLEAAHEPALVQVNSETIELLHEVGQFLNSAAAHVGLAGCRDVADSMDKYVARIGDLVRTEAIRAASEPPTVEPFGDMVMSAKDALLVSLGIYWGDLDSYAHEDYRKAAEAALNAAFKVAAT